MGGEDLVTLLIFVAFILWGVTAGSRKKQRRAPPGTPPLQRIPPQERSELRGRLTGTGSRPQGDLASELYDLLRGQLPSEPPPVAGVPAEPPAVPTSHPPPMPAASEAVSLETLEPDWDKAEAEFHRKYVDRKPGAEPAKPTRRLRQVTPHTAREAVIWMTIFDRPKGW